MSMYVTEADIFFKQPNFLVIRFNHRANSIRDLGKWEIYTCVQDCRSQQKGHLQPNLEIKAINNMALNKTRVA